jgi:hypothetical protein
VECDTIGMAAWKRVSKAKNNEGKEGNNHVEVIWAERSNCSDAHFIVKQRERDRGEAGFEYSYSSTKREFWQFTNHTSTKRTCSPNTTQVAYSCKDFV